MLLTKNLLYIIKKRDKMRLVKIILYFLILQVMIFSEPKQLNKVVYYNYNYRGFTEKLKSGMEIHKVKGYCGTTDFVKECSGLLQVLDPKYANGTEKNMQSVIKLDIDLSNFTAKKYGNITFDNDYLDFNSESDIVLGNSQKESIKKIRKMLMIHDLVKNITTDEEIIEADDGPSSMTGTIHIKKDFSTYIIIKTPELSYFPPMYVIDYENINKSIWNLEYKGRDFDELYQYLKQFIAKNKNKDGKIPEKKYDEFMKKEIYETNFYPELTREILKLNNELGYNFFLE